MLLTEKKLKQIIKECIQNLTEGRLATNIAASERVMNELSKQYASMWLSKMSDQNIRSELVYFLEQNCGVCERPDAISKALREIWDKIQTGAQKYGFTGTVMPVKKDDVPNYIKEKAQKAAADEELMRWLGASYYYAKRRGNLAWEKNQKNAHGMVNGLIVYPEFRKIVGYLTFKEAKLVIKCLEKDIKRAARAYEKEEAEKEAKVNTVSEAVYKNVLKKLKQNGQK